MLRQALRRPDPEAGTAVSDAESRTKLCFLDAAGEVLQLVSKGAMNRHVAATKANTDSSRSHCVFSCVLESKCTEDGVTSLRTSCLKLVDLAGRNTSIPHHYCCCCYCCAAASAVAAAASAAAAVAATGVAAASAAADVPAAAAIPVAAAADVSAAAVPVALLLLLLLLLLLSVEY